MDLTVLLDAGIHERGVSGMSDELDMECSCNMRPIELLDGTVEVKRPDVDVASANAALTTVVDTGRHTWIPHAASKAFSPFR